MATITNNVASVTGSYSGSTMNNSTTIKWMNPDIPSGAIVNSYKLTGTVTINATNKNVTVSINDLWTTNGAVGSGTHNFEIELPIDWISNVSEVALALKLTGNHNKAAGSVTVDNLEYTVDYTLMHTVTFVDWDGTVLDTQQVGEGTSATEPNNPTRDEYRFIGWDIDFSNVTSDLTVTAQYIKREYFTVRFLDWDGTVLKTETVEAGYAATPPANPTKENYYFSNWDKPYDNITANIDITAQYIDESGLIKIIEFKYTTGSNNIDPDIYCGDTQWVDYITNEVSNSDGTKTRTLFRIAGGTCPTFLSFDNVYNNRLTEILYLDTSILSSFNAVFRGCIYLEKINAVDWKLDHITDFNDFIDMYSAATGTHSCVLTEITGIENWNMRNAINMDGILGGTGIVSLDLSKWNATSVETMNYAFSNNKYLKTFNAAGWDTSKVTNMNGLFMGCAALESININGWDLTNCGINDIYNVFFDNDTIVSNVEMIGCSTESVSIMINYILNDRTDDSVSGTLKISPGTCSSADRTTASSKNWNIIEESIEPEESVNLFPKFNRTNWNEPGAAMLSPLSDYSVEVDSASSQHYVYAAVDESIKGKYVKLGAEALSSNATMDVYIGHPATSTTKAITVNASKLENGFNAPINTETIYIKLYSNAINAETIQVNNAYLYIANEKFMYNVTFKDYDGTVLKTEQVEEGASATAPNNPTRDGYVFTSWNKDFSNVTSDLTVTAQYEEATVNLFPSFIDGGWNCADEDEFEMTPMGDFNAEFHSISAYYEYSVNISQFKGKTIKLLVDDINLVSMRICRNGSTTIGSIISSSTGRESYCTIPNDDNSYNIQIVPVSQGGLDSSITNAQLYILGEETSIRAYTVEFGPYDYIPGNTDNALKVEGVLEGEDATPPENVPTREGYRFIGWSGSYTNVTSDLVLTAQYEPEEPEVSLNTQIQLGGQPIESLYFGEDAILKICLGDIIIYSFEQP